MKIKISERGIRPHFLFNSLSSIASLTGNFPDRAESAIYDLADVLRASMRDPDQMGTLAQELDIVEKYLSLETIRLGDRLRVSRKIEPNVIDTVVPKFLLQPMMENAVYHGIEAQLNGGMVGLHVKIEGKQLAIKITNPIPETKGHHLSGNEDTVQHLKKRLLALYRNCASLDSYEANNIFNIIIRLPLSK